MVLPDSNLLEGGGHIKVLVFYNELPLGNKFVNLFSHKRQNSWSVATTQVNAWVLFMLIPRCDVSETLLLQVYCEGHF